MEKNALDAFICWFCFVMTTLFVGSGKPYEMSMMTWSILLFCWRHTQKQKDLVPLDERSSHFSFYRKRIMNEDIIIVV